MFIIALLVALGLVAAIVGAQMSRRRREALSELARRWNLSFHPEHLESGSRGSFLERLLTSGAIAGPYQQFARFQRGTGRRAYNTMTGSIDLAGHRCTVWAGDFRYQTQSGSGKNRRTVTHRFSYLLVTLPFAARTTTIRPENFLDRIGEFIGIDDIDFESEAFSRAFHVTGHDKRFAYDLCDPLMMEYLMETRPPAFVLKDADPSGRHWLLMGDSSTWNPEVFDRHLRWVDGFLGRWPRHLQGHAGSATLGSVAG